jgi:hypothetical protein
MESIIMRNIRKIVAPWVLALLLVAAAASSVTAQTMVCTTTTTTYTTTYYYSNGSTMTYQWQETVRYCEPLNES